MKMNNKTESVSISREKLRRKYKEATPEMKASLRELCGADIIEGLGPDREDIDNLQSLDGICAAEHKGMYSKDIVASIMAYTKLILFIREANGTWVADWGNTEQPKWLPIFSLRHGQESSKLEGFDCAYEFTYSRPVNTKSTTYLPMAGTLACKDRATAIRVVKEHPELWRAFLIPSEDFNK